jgi:hypothetical protein
VPHPSHSRKVHRFGKLLVPTHRNKVDLCPRVDRHCPVEASQILTVLSSLALARDLPSGLHFTVLTYLKAFKSVSMHKNNCFEKVRGMFLRNLPRVPAQRGPNLGARFCVPNPNRKVPPLPPPTANYLCATRREADRPDGVLVPAQRRLTLARLRVPHRDSLVPASTDQGRAVWAPCHRPDPAFAMR